MKKFIHRIQDFSQKAGQLKEVVEGVPGQAARLCDTVLVTAGQLQEVVVVPPALPATTFTTTPSPVAAQPGSPGTPAPSPVAVAGESETLDAAQAEVTAEVATPPKPAPAGSRTSGDWRSSALDRFKQMPDLSKR
jgi:hypothetical protein